MFLGPVRAGDHSKRFYALQCLLAVLVKTMARFMRQRIAMCCSILLAVSVFSSNAFASGLKWEDIPTYTSKSRSDTDNPRQLQLSHQLFRNPGQHPERIQVKVFPALASKIFTRGLDDKSELSQLSGNQTYQAVSNPETLKLSQKTNRVIVGQGNAKWDDIPTYIPEVSEEINSESSSIATRQAVRKAIDQDPVDEFFSVSGSSMADAISGASANRISSWSDYSNSATGNVVSVANNDDQLIIPGASSAYSSNDSKAQLSAYSEALSALSNRVNQGPRSTPSGGIEKLSRSLDGHAYDSDSLILQGQSYLKGTAFNSGDRDGRIQTSTFVSQRSRKNDMGNRYDTGNTMGMLVTGSPFGADSDQLKISMAYLQGTDTRGSIDSKPSRSRINTQHIQPESFDDQAFSLYNTQWQSEVVSAALESYLMDGKFWIRGETASSIYDSDVSDTRSNGVRDKAHSLLADLTLLENEIAGKRVYWSAGVEDQSAGPWFRSAGNSSNLESWRTQNAYSSLSVGNLRFTTAAGVDTENVSRSEVRPAEKDRWNSFTTAYRFKDHQSWLGKPRLSYTYGNTFSSETDVPVGFSDDLYLADTVYHDLSATMTHPWGYLRVGYNQSYIDDRNGNFSDRDLAVTSLGASYRLSRKLQLFGRLSHNSEDDLTLDDSARQWSGSLGFRLSGRDSSWRFQYGQSDFNALTGFDDRESKTLSTRYSWNMNPETRFWLRGNYRNSSNNNDSLLLLLGVELGARSQFQ
jgi:hypothetical protein